MVNSRDVGDGMVQSRQALTTRLLAGTVGGLIAAIFAISHASLISGSAAPEATVPAIGLALTGTFVFCVVLGIWGRTPGAIAMSQDVPSAAMGAILLTIVNERATGSGSVSVAEVVILSVVSGLAFGLALILFGMFRLSVLMRYAPRPVLAGFLAGTGYFVVIGALAICLGDAVSFGTLGGFLEATALSKLLVTLAVTGVLAFGGRFLPPSYAIAIIILGAIFLFHLIAGLFGITPDALAANGWFAQVPESGLTWPPISPSEVANVDLSFLSGVIIPLLTMIVLATTALLMMSATLEATTRVELDLDRELRVVGFANIGSAVLGGLPGYTSLSATMSALRIADGHRIISFVAASIALLIFTLGHSILGLLPLPVFAGFLLWVGLALVREWLYLEVQRTPAKEAWLTFAIFIVIAFFGLFEGTIFGLIAGSFLFIFEYSKADPVRGQFFGDVYHGSSEMTPEKLQVLEQQGGSIVILKLQGYVFFGTAYKLRERLSSLMADREITHVLFDFEGVTGADATAMAGFRRMEESLREAGAKSYLCGLDPAVANVFEKSNFVWSDDRFYQKSVDLDAALTAAEADLFDTFLDHPDQDTAPVAETLQSILGDRAMAERMGTYLERVNAKEGEKLVQEGAAAADILFLETGKVEILIGSGSAQRRVRTMGPGSIIGEISFYTGGTRTSSVRALADVRAWRLSEEGASNILNLDPQLSSRFHAGLAAMLAERVTANTRLIQVLKA